MPTHCSSDTEGCYSYLDGYKIMNNGDIIGIKGNILKTFIKNGYKAIKIREKHFYIHRLLAQKFIKNFKNKPQVNHKDGNKLNNNLSNLEWVTCSEQIKHAYKNNLIPFINRRPFNKIKVYFNNNLIKEFNNVHTAAKYRNVHINSIYRYCKGQRNDKLGFEWVAEERILKGKNRRKTQIFNERIKYSTNFMNNLKLIDNIIN